MLHICAVDYIFNSPCAFIHSLPPMKKILFKTIYSSFFVIRDRKLERRPPSFSGLFCFIGPAEFAYLRILPSPLPPSSPKKKKNLLMPLVYYHLKHGIKKTKQNKTKQVPIVIMVLSFKIKNQQMQNKSSRLKQITHRWPLNWVYLFIL